MNCLSSAVNSLRVSFSSSRSEIRRLSNWSCSCAIAFVIHDALSHGVASSCSIHVGVRAPCSDPWTKAYHVMVTLHAASCPVADQGAGDRGKLTEAMESRVDFLPPDHDQLREPNDAAALWKSEIARDAVSVDARGSREAVSASGKNDACRRSAERRISAIESKCTNPDVGRWRSGAVGIEAINLYLAQKYDGPMHCAAPEVLGLAAQWSFWAVLEIEQLLLNSSGAPRIAGGICARSLRDRADELLPKKPWRVLNDALAASG